MQRTGREGAKGGVRSHGNLSLAQCPAPRGGEQQGLILCQAGMLSAFQSQLHGRAGCLRFHFRCQILLFLSFTFYSKYKCGCMTKQILTDPSTLKWEEIKKDTPLVAKNQIVGKKHVVQCLRLNGLHLERIEVSFALTASEHRNSTLGT